MGNKCRKIILMLLSINAIIGCGSDKKPDFYCDTNFKYDTDVWRLPIVEPFELITVDSSTFWSLNWPRTPDKAYLEFQYNADSITYKDGVIMIVYDYGNVFNRGVIDIKQGKVIEFKSRDEFYKFRSEDSMLHKLYSVKDLFREYLKTRSLPWSTEIPNYERCK
jgi:hypothetical protein